MGLTGIPVAAEVAALSLALALATTCDTRIHLHGLSSAAGVALLRAAKGAGLPVTADTPIWNLHYTDLDIGAYDPAFHLRPPLREAGDRAALREALADGTLDAVCSDHRPFDGEAKRQPFARCAAGVAGFEALLPLILAPGAGRRVAPAAGAWRPSPAARRRCWATAAGWRSAPWPTCAWWTRTAPGRWMPRPGTAPRTARRCGDRRCAAGCC